MKCADFSLRCGRVVSVFSDDDAHKLSVILSALGFGLEEIKPL
jgi:hypothetical protein